jgi:hypothetical protein
MRNYEPRQDDPSFLSPNEARLPNGVRISQATEKELALYKIKLPKGAKEPDVEFPAPWHEDDGPLLKFRCRR